MRAIGCIYFVIPNTSRTKGTLDVSVEYTVTAINNTVCSCSPFQMFRASLHAELIQVKPLTAKYVTARPSVPSETKQATPQPNPLDPKMYFCLQRRPFSDCCVTTER